MITVISSTKSINLEKNLLIDKSTMPQFEHEAGYLASILKNYTVEDIEKLMKVSEKLAEVNYNRYQKFNEKDLERRQALFAFSGDVYKSMNPFQYTEEQIEFAQERVRILSGLFGVLKPLDLIKEYRLEMATKIKGSEVTDLYSFWSDKITKSLIKEVEDFNEKAVLNLASLEYSKVINRSKLGNVRIYDVEFKENRDGEYKIIGTYAKKARGEMVTYVVSNRIDSIDGIKGFCEGGYRYSDELSSENILVFTR
ncbi:MAG: peroxide stress protein YaaA [Clostridium sp.]|uniref:peroxide stress protein YaaA n=1 Tax=Clostridium sp. TaxID=1506 RepID=UPI00302FB9D8